jgi:hypothetical protein
MGGAWKFFVSVIPNGPVHVHLDFVAEKKSSWFPYRTRAKEIPE